MRRVTGVSFVVFVSSILLPAAASAQATGASAIAGVARDTSGAVLPGVTVEAASPALIEKVRTVATDAQGQYRIVDLRPGMYTVTFTLSGFNTVRREGIELVANFTASINADMQVGALAETIIVSGAAPLVDIQNLTQQTRLTQELLQTVPITRTVTALISVMPSVVSSPSVGMQAAKGDYDFKGSVHGSRGNDQRLLLDGMRYNAPVGTGSNFGFFANPASAETIVIEVAAGGSAEYSTSGIQMNIIPKTGGNRFSGDLFANYAGESFASDNLSAELQARGARKSSQVLDIYDLNGSVGGPIKSDKVWFHTAHRRWSITEEPVGHYLNATPGTFLYTPDLSRQGHPKQLNRSHNVRLTWQASQKNKISGYYDYQHNDDCPNSEILNLAPEATQCLRRNPSSQTQFKWTAPVTSKLLFDLGVSLLHFNRARGLSYSATPNDISILEQSSGFRYQAPAATTTSFDYQMNARFAVSYVTGSHHFKMGLALLQAKTRTVTNRAVGDVSYTFLNAVPISLTQYAAPTRTEEEVRPELGLYVQDQWTIRRLTLNYGLRFESLHGYVPASQQPAGRLIDARSFEAVDCVPCWKDLTPRIGVAYDLFGDGRTALKASFGRYLNSELLSFAGRNNPVTTSVNAVNRSWTDNGNFVPDCDLRNPLLNGECGQLDNLNFGGSNIVTRFDPELLNGWHKRTFNNQVSISIDHELRPGLSIGGGYYRTWFGNLTVTDNLEVTPQDFDPYCITVPVDQRLPGGGGNQICGLYNITPSKFGRVNNLVTFASNYGEQSETYNGVDVTFALRHPGGAHLSGGITIGNSVATQTTVGNETVSATNACFVVDSPQQLYQCDVHPPYAPQFKLTGSYPLPWDLEASANFQSLPGAAIGATYNVPTAEIARTLGRNLAGGVRTAPVQVIDRLSMFEGRITQVDVRLARSIRVRQLRIKGLLDIYNVLNAGAVLSSNATYGSNWRNVQELLHGRLFKIGVQMEF